MLSVKVGVTAGSFKLIDAGATIIDNSKLCMVLLCYPTQQKQIVKWITLI